MKINLNKGLMPLFLCILILFSNKEMNAQAIKLTWSPNPENDIKYYEVYRDTLSNPETEIAKVYAPDTTYLDNNIVVGEGYYYRITAVDSAENISEFSDEIYITSAVPTPVELVSFSAKFISDQVVLIWNTISESNNLGFEIQKGNDDINFSKIGFVLGSGTSINPHSYEFEDKDVSLGKYYYRLKQINTNGSYEYSNVMEVQVGVPENFNLSQNYPNPFNPETTIEYTIAKAGNVNITIYDVLGREIRLLVDSHKAAGNYSVKWDSKDNSDKDVSSGLYLCQMKGDGFNKTIKIMLTR